MIDRLLNPRKALDSSGVSSFAGGRDSRVGLPLIGPLQSGVPIDVARSVCEWFPLLTPDLEGSTNVDKRCKVLQRFSRIEMLYVNARPITKYCTWVYTC